MMHCLAECLAGFFAGVIIGFYFGWSVVVKWVNSMAKEIKEIFTNA